MKIISVQYHDERHTFAASFDDGITTILDADLQYKNMLSTGLDSYFIKKGKWPTKKNIQRRHMALGTDAALRRVRQLEVTQSLVQATGDPRANVPIFVSNFVSLNLSSSHRLMVALFHKGLLWAGMRHDDLHFRSEADEVFDELRFGPKQDRDTEPHRDAR